MKLAFDSDLLLESTGRRVAPSKVLFVTEASSWGALGREVVASAFDSVEAVYWSPGMSMPDLSEWDGDWIISFKADLILSRATLERANKGAINFHPSPPRYRGLGGYWWALHNRDASFGITVHHMDERIDHGEIINTASFTIWPRDTVDTLKHRGAVYALMLLNETVAAIVDGKSLASNGMKWGAHLYTSKELALAQSAKADHTLDALDLIQSGIAALSEDNSDKWRSTHDNPNLTLGSSTPISTVNSTRA
jgi:methionyl-tRNA formyltransferase